MCRVGDFSALLGWGTSTLRLHWEPSKVTAGSLGGWGAWGSCCQPSQGPPRKPESMRGHGPAPAPTSFCLPPRLTELLSHWAPCFSGAPHAPLWSGPLGWKLPLHTHMACFPFPGRSPPGPVPLTPVTPIFKLFFFLALITI